jgi:beta-glucosidase-like glycosyl hydrolase/CubicO group peptidase (beta-lactamase class C family)
MNWDRAWLLLLTAFLFMATKGRAQSKQSSSAKPSPTRPAAAPRFRLSADAERWVEATLRKMSAEEKVGQLLFITFHGSLTPTESAAYKELLRQVEKLHIGGFIVATEGSPLGVVKSQAYPTAALANQLQSRAKLPLLIGADFERGTAMRLDEGTSFPTAMALAAAGNPRDAYEMGRITALEARAVGVHWIYAPDADVNSNPANPIINTRSFGEDPARVAEFVAAYVRGVEENGALATAKHFPGHGDTATDSHLDLPLIHADRARLESMELVPFRASIRAGTSTIMTGHLAVPALEPDPNVPATLSPRILTDLLRKELQFEGLVVTDALNMGGITVRYPPGEAAVRAILAGADGLLFSPVPDAAFAALRDAVVSGRIPRQRLDDSVRRILRAKARLGLHKQRLVNLNDLNAHIARPEWAAEAQEMSDRGVTLLRDVVHALPLDATKPTRALLLALSGDPEPYAAEDLERELRWRVDSLETVRCDTKFVKAPTVKIPPLDRFDLVIVALFVRVSDRKGSVGLPDDQVALARQVLSAAKPTVVLAFGSPYLIEQFPEAPVWLSAFGISDVAQVSAARALFGQIPIRGRLPVSIPAARLKAGDGIALNAAPMRLAPMDSFAEGRLRPAYEAMERAVADAAFPGGVLAVGYRGQLAARAFGKLSYEKGAAPVGPDTIYDLASLTKVVVTTTLAARLTESPNGGTLQLDAPIERYLPEWASGPQPEWRKQVTVRHLLTHTSGLPPHRDYFLTSKNKRQLLEKIFAEPLESQPGTKEAYSDLGIILLGEIIERLTGKSLDELARTEIFRPLGMTETMFLPPKKLLPRIAPTEDDTRYRKRLIRGEVHDENAYALGGVAGHAGLFGTASDLAAFCQMLLNGGIYAHHRLLRRSTVAEFTTPQRIADNTRTLGWAVPTENSSSGHYFSPHSFGHTGFTGTSIWIDPDKQLFVILLTNRVHPARENQKIQQVRPAIHDAVVEALGLVPAAVAKP